MKDKCPRCKSEKDKKVVQYHKAENHIDGLSGFHLACPDCGLHWLVFEQSTEKIRKAYDNVKDYF